MCAINLEYHRKMVKIMIERGGARFEEFLYGAFPAALAAAKDAGSEKQRHNAYGRMLVMAARVKLDSDAAKFVADAWLEASYGLLDVMERLDYQDELRSLAA